MAKQAKQCAEKEPQLRLDLTMMGRHSRNGGREKH